MATRQQEHPALATTTAVLRDLARYFHRDGVALVAIMVRRHPQVAPAKLHRLMLAAAAIYDEADATED